VAHPPGIARALRQVDALIRFKDRRFWHLALMAVDHMAAWLIATGELDAATVVYGHLDHHQPERATLFDTLIQRSEHTPLTAITRTTQAP
jgi:hypothetical protein